MDDETKEPRVPPETAGQAESLNTFFPPKAQQASGTRASDIPNIGSLAPLPYGAQGAVGAATSQYQRLQARENQASIPAPFRWMNAGKPTPEQAGPSSVAQPSLPVPPLSLRPPSLLHGRPGGPFDTNSAAETSQGFPARDSQPLATFDPREALAAELPDADEYTELLNRQLRIPQSTDGRTSTTPSNVGLPQHAAGLPLFLSSTVDEAAPSVRSFTPYQLTPPGRYLPSPNGVLWNSLRALSLPEGKWLSAPVSGVNPAMVEQALGSAGPGLTLAPLVESVDLSVDQPGNPIFSDKLPAWEQSFAHQKQASKHGRKRKVGAGQLQLTQPEDVQVAGGGVVVLGSRRQGSNSNMDLLSSPKSIASDRGGQGTQDFTQVDMLTQGMLEGPAISQPSSGGASVAGSQSLLAPTFFESEGPSKEKEDKVISQEGIRRKERRKKLRELRTKPCGCSQDWPNDVQELRAKCNDLTRELFSMQLQREMSHRRDSQQVLEIAALKGKVRELERALAEAREGRSPRTYKEK